MTLADGGQDELLDALAEVRRQRVELDSLERRLVAEARRVRVTWRDIGDALGVSATAVHKRYRALDPRSRRRQRDPIQAELDALFAAVRERRLSTQGKGSDPSTRVESERR